VSAGSLPSGTVTFLFTDVEGSTRLSALSGVRALGSRPIRVRMAGDLVRVCRVNGRGRIDWS
jgi:hypothetical protein